MSSDHAHIAMPTNKQLKMNCDEEEEETYTQDAIFRPLRDKKSLPSCMQVHTMPCPALPLHV